MRIALLLGLVLVTSLNSAAARGDNLLKNGGFDLRAADAADRPADWIVVPGQAPLVFAPEHHSGQLAAQLQGDGKSRMWRQDVFAPAQRAWTLSGMVKAKDVKLGKGDYAYLYAHVLLRDRPYSEAIQFYVPLKPGTYDWQRFSVEGAAPEGFEIERIQISVTGKLQRGRYFIDDVALVPRDPAISSAVHLQRKVDDLKAQLLRIGKIDPSVDVAMVKLEAASTALSQQPPNLAEGVAAWQAAALAVSHEAWTAMYPDAMSDRPIEAQMVYHGFGPDEASCNAYLDKIELTGANGTFLSFGSWMQVNYHSDLLPVEKGWEKFDALKYFIEAVHRRGIKVFGYVATFYGTTDAPPQPGSIAEQHPEWIAHGPDPAMPKFPDPANPEVAEFAARMYVELATKYNLDGIGLDYIRYPTPISLNYDERNRQAILDEYGIDILKHENLVGDAEAWKKIQQYRCKKVGEVIRRVHSEVRKARPEMRTMACLISERELARDDYGQDWARSSRWVDYATPMNYDDRALDQAMLREQKEAFSKSGAVYIPAIGGMPEVHEAWTISDWARRVAAQRPFHPDGIILYRLGDLDPAVAAFFGKGPFYSATDFPQPHAKK